MTDFYKFLLFKRKYWKSLELILLISGDSYFINIRISSHIATFFLWKRALLIMEWSLFMEIFWWIKLKSKSTISAESIKKAVVTKMRIFRKETFFLSFFLLEMVETNPTTVALWRCYFTKLGFGSSNFAFFFFLTSFRCWISSASKLVVSSCGKLLVLRNVSFEGSFDSIKLSISRYSRSYKTNDHWLTFISRRLWCSLQNLSIEYDINECNENVNLDHNSVANELNKPIYQFNLIHFIGKRKKKTSNYSNK